VNIVVSGSMPYFSDMQSSYAVTERKSRPLTSKLAPTDFQNKINKLHSDLKVAEAERISNSMAHITH
jgi:hypothetical protein